MGIETLFGLVVVAGALCGYLAMARVNSLTRDIRRLRRDLNALQGPPSTTVTVDRKRDSPSQENAAAADKLPRSPAKNEGQGQSNFKRTGSFSVGSSAPSAALAHARDNWMIWLGGVCVSLAGVFLVRYSIDAGILGPGARIASGLVFGLACHGFAEYVRRKSQWSFAAVATLAGAGSVTMYAALLSALRLYDLISPGIAFVSMAAVALGTMLMARLHGPLLAAFGILGAFLVPILVSTGSGNIAVLLVYATIVSASALFLLRHVYRHWLWWGYALGALFWGLVATSYSGFGGAVSLYFALLTYLTAAIPEGDWLIFRNVVADHKSYQPRSLFRSAAFPDRSRFILYLLFAGAVCLAILSDGNVSVPWMYGVPFLIVALLLARKQDHLCWLPWIVLLCTSSAWLLTRLAWQEGTVQLARLAPDEQGTFLGFLLLQAAIASGLSLWSLSQSRRPGVFASMATLTPGLLLALAYLLVSRPDTDWNWGMATAIIGLTYLTIAVTALRKLSVDSLVVWLFVGAHFLLALAASMLFQEASLSLAIAAQLLSLAWVIQRFELPGLAWLLKLVVAVVIVRLTFNPWLPNYPIDVHWSLWTYGGATLFAAGAARLLQSHSALRAWLSAAALHLLVLTLWSELRYQLYKGEVYLAEFSFTEAVFSMLLFGSLGLVYLYRVQFSTHLVRFVQAYAGLLLALFAAIYAIVLLRTLNSEAWVYTAISSRAVLNLGTLAFAGPVVIIGLLTLVSDALFRRQILALCGCAVLVFVTLQIRHLWSGTLRIDYPDVSNPELYTYSAVWLLMAIAAVIAGATRFGPDVYRAGVLLLGLVIAKLFFWDMSGLEGLLRVASFMGLGLSLLGLSFLHKRFAGPSNTL